MPASDALELAVVLPTYTERDNVASMVARLGQALEGIGWEAIFVDDDSTDGTADAARRIAATDRRIRVIQRIGRRGLASAAIEGMCATAAPVDPYPSHVLRLLRRTIHLSTPLPEAVRQMIDKYRH